MKNYIKKKLKQKMHSDTICKIVHHVFTADELSSFIFITILYLLNREEVIFSSAFVLTVILELD